MNDARLQLLLDKEEIREVLVRWCQGIDRGDIELMSSVYHDDAVDSRGAHYYDHVNPAPDYVARHERWKRHLHYAMNEQISVDGDVARCESYFMAHLVIEEDGADNLYQYGGRHFDRFERRAGVWKIANRLAILEWRTISPVIMLPDRTVPEYPALNALNGGPQYGELGSKSKADPAYNIP
jgi:ketosteroid isomerase-like protein